ncbi:MAG: cation transporter [Crocinitomicaceae bacterium]|nr:cation transporter [Crocinitomicaceae bacterium]
MLKSEFEISKMDCPSEEAMIRTALGQFGSIMHLDFNLEKRTLIVYHNAQANEIEKSIIDLNLGGKLQSTTEVADQEFDSASNQRKLLWTVLIINFAFFGIEMTTGLISNSMGLVADSLDMLADSFVYGISLIAVGGTIARKKNIAKLAGYFQITLALIGFVEIVRRFIGEENMPDFRIMIIVSVFALIANAACLYLLQKSKSEEAHMKATMIFTSNDIIINTGVILAGILVIWLNSSWPDLFVGAIVFVLVLQGAARILKLGR